VIDDEGAYVADVVRNWAVAITLPNSERRVARKLKDGDVGHRLFLQRRSRVYRGRVIERLAPALPRYILIEIERCWEIALQTKGVVGLVKFGDQLAILRDSELRRFESYCDGDVLKPLAIVEPFEKGELVKIKGYGLLAGQTATYDGLIEGGKMRLLIGWMGRLVPIEVDNREVESYARYERKRRKRRNKRRSSKRGRVPRFLKASVHMRAKSGLSV
jgi:transcription antitermination factor NusG